MPYLNTLGIRVYIGSERISLNVLVCAAKLLFLFEHAYIHTYQRAQAMRCEVVYINGDKFGGLERIHTIFISYDRIALPWTEFNATSALTVRVSCVQLGLEFMLLLPQF